MSFMDDRDELPLTLNQFATCDSQPPPSDGEQVAFIAELHGPSGAVVAFECSLTTDESGQINRVSFPPGFRALATAAGLDDLGFDVNAIELEHYLDFLVRVQFTHRMAAKRRGEFKAAGLPRVVEPRVVGVTADGTRVIGRAQR